MLDGMVAQGFLSPQVRALLFVDTQAAPLLQRLAAAAA